MPEVKRAGFESLEIGRRRQADRHVVEMKPAGDMAREDRDRFRAGLGRQQDIAAEIEQPRQFVASIQRLALPVPRDGRQAARHQADRQEREQRDPVLGIRDRECADRRKKEEVERQHRRDRRHDRDPERRRGGDEQDDEEVRDRDRGVVGHPKPRHVEGGDPSHARQRDQEMREVASPSERHVRRVNHAARGTQRGDGPSGALRHVLPRSGGVFARSVRHLTRL